MTNEAQPGGGPKEEVAWYDWDHHLGKVEKDEDAPEVVLDLTEEIKQEMEDAARVSGGVTPESPEAQRNRSRYEWLVDTVLGELPSQVSDAFKGRLFQWGVRTDDDQSAEVAGALDNKIKLELKAGNQKPKLVAKQEYPPRFRFFVQNLNRILKSFEGIDPKLPPAEKINIMLKMVEDGGEATDLMLQLIDEQGLTFPEVDDVWEKLVDAREVKKAVRKNCPTLEERGRARRNPPKVEIKTTKPIEPPPPESPGLGYEFSLSPPKET